MQQKGGIGYGRVRKKVIAQSTPGKPNSNNSAVKAENELIMAEANEVSRAILKLAMAKERSHKFKSEIRRTMHNAAMAAYNTAMSILG